MMTEVIDTAFFDRDIHRVARDLLGRTLVRRRSDDTRRARIVEVEVYEGQNDAASHARSGEPTDRTWPMFDRPGRIYVYTIYGMYHCLNLRAPSQSGPGAILIRAAAPVEGAGRMAVGRGLIATAERYDATMDSDLLSGPGKLCQALDIGPEMSGEMLGDGMLALEPGEPVCQNDPDSVDSTPRIGLNPDTCGESCRWPWRYIVADSPWTSCRAG